MSETFSLQQPMTILTYEALQIFSGFMAQPLHPDDLPTDFNERAPARAWKEVKFWITEPDLQIDARRNHLEPMAHVLSDKFRAMKTCAFPFAVLPDAYEADPASRLEMAVATDPVTGFSLRGRRWHSVDKDKDYIAFDIASEGYESTIGFVGPWLVA